MHTTSAPLLGRIRIRTDHDSWTQFVRLYAPILYRWHAAAGLQHADAQEVVQEVLLFVHQRIHRFQRQRPGAFRSWLRAVSQNKVRERRRRKHLDDGVVSLADHLDSLQDPKAAGDWAARHAEAVFLRACEMIRESVEDTTWRIFMQVYTERRPADAVARDFGVSRNTVYVAQCRCLAKVRQIVARYLEDSI